MEIESASDDVGSDNSRQLVKDANRGNGLVPAWYDSDDDIL